MKKMLDLRIGEALEDDEFNRKISPLYHIDNIRCPLIIAQGANDPRCFHIPFACHGVDRTILIAACDYLMPTVLWCQ